MQLLANAFVKIFESPDPENFYVYTPGLCVLPNGTYLATMDLGGPGMKQAIPPLVTGKIFLSADKGKTWRETAVLPFHHARPFWAGNAAYILGVGDDGNLCITRSCDSGQTWAPLAPLTKGQHWHQSACNVWYKGGFLYLVMERADPAVKRYGWNVHALVPVLMRAHTQSDLTHPESWTFASSFPFAKAVSERALDFHGIPFYNTLMEQERFPSGYLAEPAGWLETNVVQILDEKHYWYDETGRTFHLFMRCHTAGSGYCAMAKVVENADGSMETSLVSAPSGKKWVFLPMPGGQMRFHMLYDPETRLYWLLSTQATDSMTQKELLSDERYNIPCDERQRLQLSFSKNCVDWCFAGLVAAGPSEKQSRHYASMAFDGEDILIASRSGDHRAKSAHNGNIISFHRVENFRDLVY